jgi:hypothetical protein
MLKFYDSSLVIEYVGVHLALLRPTVAQHTKV